MSAYGKECLLDGNAIDVEKAEFWATGCVVWLISGIVFGIFGFAAGLMQGPMAGYATTMSITSFVALGICFFRLAVVVSRQVTDKR